jgi:TRAP-type C4-dicarboxylate transport system permease small subunit
MVERTKFQRRVIALDKLITFAENTISIACFTAMIVLVLAGVASRFIFHIPFMWVEEASRYFMVAGVYVGVSMGIREKTHLGLTALVDALDPGKRKILRLTLSFIVIALCAYFSIYSISFMQQVRANGQKSPALLFPMWIVYIPLGIGFVFGTIRGMMVFWNDFICEVPVLPYGEDKARGN